MNTLYRMVVKTEGDDTPWRDSDRQVVNTQQVGVAKALLLLVPHICSAANRFQTIFMSSAICAAHLTPETDRERSDCNYSQVQVRDCDLTEAGCFVRGQYPVVTGRDSKARELYCQGSVDTPGCPSRIVSTHSASCHFFLLKSRDL